jgi:diketogulonate reductase-like aldo/keto reductase
VALAWVLRQKDLIAIPKAGTPAHVDENRAALNIELGDEDLTVLDRAFLPPSRPRPLEML